MRYFNLSSPDGWDENHPCLLSLKHFSLFWEELQKWIINFLRAKLKEDLSISALSRYFIASRSASFSKPLLFLLAHKLIPTKDASSIKVSLDPRIIDERLAIPIILLFVLKNVVFVYEQIHGLLHQMRLSFPSNFTKSSVKTIGPPGKANALAPITLDLWNKIFGGLKLLAFAILLISF